MADHQVAPQPRSLFAAAGEGDPFGSRAWMPRYFYRAIAHADSRANGRSIVKRRRLTAPAFTPMPKGRGPQPGSLVARPCPRNAPARKSPLDIYPWDAHNAR